jgi:hypothetical protein
VVSRADLEKVNRLAREPLSCVLAPLTRLCCKALGALSTTSATFQAEVCVSEGCVAVARQRAAVWALAWAAATDPLPAAEASLALAAMTLGAAGDRDDQDEALARKDAAAAGSLLMDLDALNAAGMQPRHGVSVGVGFRLTSPPSVSPGLPMVAVRPAALRARLRRAAAALRFLHTVSQTCDGMCRLVCEALSPDVLVVPPPVAHPCRPLSQRFISPFPCDAFVLRR